MNGFTVLEKGAKVFTKSAEGVAMQTVYLTFKSPNEISIKMLNKSPIFSDFRGIWNYSTTDKLKTTLKITYCFNLKFPYNLIKPKVSQKIRLNLIRKLAMLNAYLIELENTNLF